MPIYHDRIEQRTADWFQIRAGIPTASDMERIITHGGKASGQAEAYMNKLLAEWVLGEAIVGDYESRHMLDGRENEEPAVKAFEFQTGLKTAKVGFVTTDDGLIGCSPDRLVEDHGTLEIKCPASQTHIGYLLSTSVADDYKVQVQAQMWICEREKSWVSAYHPRLAPVIIEIPRDDAFIAKISAAVRTFVDVMLAKRLELEKRFGPFVRQDPYAWIKREQREPVGEFA